ncbi:multidrug efflux protein [Scheffersomyces xylosifermentans]|uniref:multidrug efflux protein n=1 Tax=Scheffersomyces xylosifermentans TaxID=1304137 RepID=UPI00315D8679
MSREEENHQDAQAAETQPLSNNTDAVLGHAAEEVYGALIDESDEEDMDEDAIWLREQRDLNKSIHWLKRPSVLSISFALFLTAMALTIGEPARQLITYQLSCNSVARNGMCDPVASQLLVSTVTQYSSFVATVFALLASSKIGELSDQYGRQPFFALFISANLLHKFINYSLYTHSKTLPFASLIASTALANVFGGMSTFIALMQAYISDVCEPHQRIYQMGLAIASLNIGQAIGPIISTFISAQFKNQITDMPHFHVAALTTEGEIKRKDIAPLQVELAIFILLTIYSVFILPESRSDKAQTKSRSNSVSSRLSGTSGNSGRGDAFAQLQALEQPTLAARAGRLLNVFRPLLLLTYPSSVVSSNNKPREGKYRFVIVSTILLSGTIASMASALGGMIIQYGIFRFDWGTDEISYTLTIFSTSMCLMLIVGSPIITHTILRKWCGFTVMKRQLDMIDFCVILYARIVDVIAFVAMAYANSTWQLIGSLSLVSLGAPGGPTVASALLKFFPPSKVGEFFGAMSLLENLIGLVVPFGTLQVFKYGMSIGAPQLGFLLLAFVTFVSVIVIIIVKRVLGLNRYSTDDNLVRSSSFVSLASSSGSVPPEAQS